MNDNVGHSGPATPSFGGEGKAIGEQTPEWPIPEWKLNEIIDRVEGEVKAVLHPPLEPPSPWEHVGTRVAYYVGDTFREYKVDRGFVDPLDQAPIVEVTEEELHYRAEGTSDPDPLAPAFVDHLYNSVEDELRPYPVTLGLVLRSLEGKFRSQGGGCICPGKFRGKWQKGGTACTSKKCGTSLL